MRRRAIGVGAVVAIVVGATAVACGGGEEPADRRVVVEHQPGDTMTHVDSATGVRLTSPHARPVEFTVVALPEGFPAVPNPPDALLTAAARDPLPGGGFHSSATLVIERRAKHVFDWYRGELDRDGWRILRQSQLGQVHQLQAGKGGATLDLAVQVHPEYPGSSWTRVLAFVQERS